jgi:hypothetical protein
MFAEYDRNKRKISTWHGHRALQMANDSVALAIDKILASHDVALAQHRSERTTTAVSAVYKSFEYNSTRPKGEALSRAIGTIVDVWPHDKDHLDADLIVGLSQFWNAYGDDEIDRETLKKRIAGWETGHIKNMAAKLSASGRGGRANEGMKRNIARLLVKEYNKASPPKRLPDRFVTAASRST